MLEDLEELKEEVRQLKATLNQILRVGVVTQVLDGEAKVKVDIADSDYLNSYTLPVLNQKTLKDKYYSLPDVGEHVAMMFLPNGLEQGFVLGAFYSDPDKTPVSDANKHHITFKDGTFVEYDRKKSVFRFEFCDGTIIEHDAKKSKLLIDHAGDIEIKAKGEFKVEAKGKIELKSDTSISANSKDSVKIGLSNSGPDEDLVISSKKNIIVKTDKKHITKAKDIVHHEY